MESVILSFGADRSLGISAYDIDPNLLKAIAVPNPIIGDKASLPVHAHDAPG